VDYSTEAHKGKDERFKRFKQWGDSRAENVHCIVWAVGRFPTGYAIADAAVNGVGYGGHGWVQSKDHEPQLRNPRFTHCGIGVFQNAAGDAFFTQLFSNKLPASMTSLMSKTRGLLQKKNEAVKANQLALHQERTQHAAHKQQLSAQLSAQQARLSQLEAEAKQAESAESQPPPSPQPSPSPQPQEIKAKTPALTPGPGPTQPEYAESAIDQKREAEEEAVAADYEQKTQDQSVSPRFKYIVKKKKNSTRQQGLDRGHSDIEQKIEDAQVAVADDEQKTKIQSVSKRCKYIIKKKQSTIPTANPTSQPSTVLALLPNVEPSRSLTRISTQQPTAEPSTDSPTTPPTKEPSSEPSTSFTGMEKIDTSGIQLASTLTIGD